MALSHGHPIFARCQHTVRVLRVLSSGSAAMLARPSTAQGTCSQETTAQGGLGENVQVARGSWHMNFAGPFSSSAVLSHKSDPNNNISHPEIPGSDIPPSQTARATGSHKPGGWDPPEIPGSMHDHPHVSKAHPSERRSSSPSLPEDDGFPNKLQRETGDYVLAKPPQTGAPIPARGSPGAPLQQAYESASQELLPSIPQHQMPGVPGDLIPPGVAPQLPQSPDSDSPPGVDPSILMSQEQQSSSASAQMTENVDSQGSGYWAGRVPGTPISHSDEQHKK